jgi:hypothetical protein
MRVDGKNAVCEFDLDVLLVEPRQLRRHFTSLSVSLTSIVGQRIVG